MDTKSKSLDQYSREELEDLAEGRLVLANAYRSANKEIKQAMVNDQTKIEELNSKIQEQQKETERRTELIKLAWQNGTENNFLELCDPKTKEMYWEEFKKQNNI